MRAVSQSNHMTAMVRRTERVNQQVNECMEAAKWAEVVAAIVSPISDEIICVPYQSVPSPAVADYLDSQFPGAEISWWTRPAATPDDPAQPKDGVAAF